MFTASFENNILYNIIFIIADWTISLALLTKFSYVTVKIQY